jgi:tRNA dimethylallyltransferase
MSFLGADEEYNVHNFQKDTLRLIDEIRARQRLPIIVGGTAYYIESVMYKDSLIELEDENEMGKYLDLYSFKRIYF